MSSPIPTPAECPVCGAAVPRGAKACRECGADERTGWNEEVAIYDGIDIPEDEFLDDPVAVRAKKERRKAVTALVTAFVLLTTLLYFVFGRPLG